MPTLTALRLPQSILQQFLKKEAANKTEETYSVDKTEFTKVKNGAPMQLRDSINESQNYVNRSRRGLSIFEVSKFKESVKADNLPIFEEKGLKP